MYTHILFLWTKGCQFFRNFMCDLTHQNSFGLGWTAVNEFRGRILYILDNIMIFLYRCIYDIMCFVLSFWFLPGFWWRNFIVIFLHDALHARIRRIIQKSVLHKILDIYPSNNFMNKGLSIFQKPHVRCYSSKFIWFGMNSFEWSV